MDAKFLKRMIMRHLYSYNILDWHHYIKIISIHRPLVQSERSTKRDDAEGYHCPKCTKQCDGDEVPEKMLLFHLEPGKYINNKNNINQLNIFVDHPSFSVQHKVKNTCINLEMRSAYPALNIIGGKRYMKKSSSLNFKIRELAPLVSINRIAPVPKPYHQPSIFSCNLHQNYTSQTQTKKETRRYSQKTSIGKNSQ